MHVAIIINFILAEFRNFLSLRYFFSLEYLVNAVNWKLF